LKVIRRLFPRWLAVAAAVLAAAPFARAQTTEPPPAAMLSWDCWVSAAQTIAIRCITARESTPPPDPTQDLREAALLDHVHNLIHSGRSGEIDGVILANLQVLKDGSVWTIHVWNQPYDSSWLEDRPAGLVRATLCPAGYSCSVLVTRP